MKTAGYIIVAPAGPQRLTTGRRGLRCLAGVGNGSAATLFPTRDEATSALLMDREYERHVNGREQGLMRIVRVVTR